MNRIRTIAAAALSAALLAGLACGDDEAPTEPTSPDGPEGTVTLAVTLTTPNTDDGAILFTVSGAAVDAPVAASTDHQLFTRQADAGSVRVALVGDLVAGALLEFEAPEGTDASAYTAEIVEVANRGTALREDLADYALTVEVP